MAKKGKLIMDEYQEIENFGTDRDFQDGEWRDGEFDYPSRTPKRHQTQDDVLYGEFAYSSNSDDDDTGFGNSDLTKPVNFVSAGFLMPIGQKVEKEDEEEDYSHTPSAGLELGFNDKLMVDSAELNVQKIDQDLRKERETLAVLQREKEKLKSETIKLKKQQSNMENIISLLDKIEEENSIGKLTLDSLANAFSDLQRLYPDDYKICKLSDIACTYAVPLFTRVFQGWDPLQNPTHGVNIVFIWKNLLEGEDIFDFSDAASPYLELFMESVYPAIRISGTITWQARDPEPMLVFLESWEKLIPPSVLQSILDNIIMPKLSSAVELWDPHMETIPIHTWMHPWLPLLGQKLETLLETLLSAGLKRR